MRVSLALFLAASSSAAHTAPAPTVRSVLAANHAGVGKIPERGTLELDYVLETSGLTGPATHIGDLATGAFIDRYDAKVISGGNGYDGRIPWQTDVSGVSIDQEEGDRIPVAVN